MQLSSKICVMGRRGLVGSALHHELTMRGYENLVYIPRQGPWKVDLRNPEEVRHWFSVARPKYIFLAAARVGGIKANIANPSEFLLDNLRIQENVMLSAAEYGCEKLV